MRGATHGAAGVVHGLSISTHAPRAGSDSLEWQGGNQPCGFQPTLPVRGATSAQEKVLTSQGISTHAPRAGSDGRAPEYGLVLDISTHAPRAGSDTSPFPRCMPSCHFNPRSPCGERLGGRKHAEGDRGISTHAPRAGSDAPASCTQSGTSPISTHAPRAGSDMPRQQLRISA